MCIHIYIYIYIYGCSSFIEFVRDPSAGALSKESDETDL